MAEEEGNHHVHFSEEVKVAIPVTMMIKVVLPVKIDDKRGEYNAL